MAEQEDCKKIAKLNYLAGILDGEGSLEIEKRFTDGRKHPSYKFTEEDE